jgi:chemotaxis protein MotB
MAGKGGGAWKVAYADFVTAMMAFFMVMWLVGQKEGVKEAVAEYFRDPPDPFSIFDEGKKSRKPGPAPDEKSEHVPQPDLPPDDLKKPRPVRFETSDRSNIGTVIFFDEFSAEVTPEAREQIKDLVPLLVGKPQTIEVRGHASRRPLPEGSPYSDAWQLCYARSMVVMKLLEEAGIPAKRIRLAQSAGYEPLLTGFNDDQQSKNPRVEVYLLNDISPAAVNMPISHNAGVN